DSEPTIDLARKRHRRVADSVGVRLHRDARERRAERRDLRHVGSGYGSTLEEIARVVEFEPGRGPFARRSQRVADLARKRAPRRRYGNGPLAKVAGRAGAGELAAGVHAYHSETRRA